MSEKQKLSRTLTGKVVSNKMDKTIVVLVARQVKHARYGKYIRRSSKLHADDQKNIAQEGDTVLIAETKPISKTKSWQLVNVIEKATEK
jgi:small subunit ribosomal protein S17